MLRTEVDVLRTLRAGTYTLQDIYREVAQSADIARDGGLAPPTPDHATDAVWRRRVRNWLQHRKQQGAARRVDRATWVIDAAPERATVYFLVADGTVTGVEMRVSDAVSLLENIDEPIDLVVCDPPYGLRRGTSDCSSHRVYATRDLATVVPGYIDVPAEDYEAFSDAWLAAAATAVRDGGQVAVVTGPQQAGVVQMAAQRAGLTFVSSIAAYKPFAKRTTRRFAFAHWTVTVMTRGPVNSRRRTFNIPADLPKARSGAAYPLDVWLDNGRADRPAGVLRYDNTLPQKLCRRIIVAHSNPGDLLCDPMLGGGAFAEAALDTGRRIICADRNPHAIRYVAARLLDERLWPHTRPPGTGDRRRHRSRAAHGQLNLLTEMPS